MADENLSKEPDGERCECGAPILIGQRVLRNVDGGFMHFDCCDDDGFVDENDEPIPAGAPKPEGFIWSENDAANG